MAQTPRPPQRELLIVRHGLAHCNVSGIVGGAHGCTGLTAAGRAQAERLAARLRRSTAQLGRIAALYASPRRRARETAEVIARAVGVPIRYDDRLLDPYMGSGADGRRWADLRAALSLGSTEFPEAPLGDGGESWADHVERVNAALQAMLAQVPSGRLMVVAHTETVLAAFHLFLDVPAAERLPVQIAMDYTALTVWRITCEDHGGDTARWQLVRHNDTGHLAGAPFSGRD